MADFSKITIDNNTYDVKDTTARSDITNATFRAITQTDFLTVNTGFSITQYDVSASNSMVIGHIIVSATNNFSSSNSTPFVIKSAYKPKISFYKNCFLGAGAWVISNFGYMFVGSSDGSCVIVSQLGTYSHAIIEFAYQI